MNNISENDLFETIVWLRKQRDGLIIGDYRNILYDLYQRISEISSNSTKTCYLKELIDEKSNYYKNENQLLELCEKLYELGYIKICKLTHDITITITKEIDF